MPTLSTSTFEAIGALMHGVAGLSFAPSKQPLIASRLAPRIQKLGLPGYEAYLELIERADDGGELQMAVDLLTTNETYFFREPQHFELLEQEFSERAPPAIRVWSAASSFGDEAYSIAMVLADLQLAGRIGDDWGVVATDISDRVLRSAVQGVVPADRLRQVSPTRLKRYCLRGEGDSEGLAMIQPALRERVRFGQLNLMQPIGDLGPFDVVFLRNVLIYFDIPTKRAVVDRVLGALRPGGLFFAGMAEGRVPCSSPLQTLGPGAFRKPG